MSNRIPDGLVERCKRLGIEVHPSDNAASLARELIADRVLMRAHMLLRAAERGALEDCAKIARAICALAARGEPARLVQVVTVEPSLPPDGDLSA
jgi:hypothetical protein